MQATANDTEEDQRDPRFRRRRPLLRRVVARRRTTACGTRCSTRCSTKRSAAAFHLTPGNAYDIADNGNRSRIHWDLVLIQRPDYGGGEIWFDGELLRKDGRFVPDDLQQLNVGL